MILMSLIAGLTQHLVKGVCFLCDPCRAKQSWAGCQCFRPAESCLPMASGWRRAHRSCKGKPSLPLYLLWLKRCHQGNKAFSRGARSPEWPLSPFSVASYCCYLAPDISSKVTFSEEIVEKFKARAVWLCRRSFGGRAPRHDWRPRKEAAYSRVLHSWGRPPALGKLD